MAPKLKTKTSADASPANATPPSPGGRNLRSSGRTLRSNSKGARLVSLEDNQMKYKMKNKGKKAYEGEDASGTIGSDAGVDAADPKGKGIKAEPEVGVSDAAGERDEDEDPVIVVEHCPQCKSFLKRATKVKDGLESSQAIEPMRSEFTSQLSGIPLFQLPSVWKDEKFEYRTRPCLSRGVKRPREAPDPLPNIIFSYGYDTAFEGGVSHNSLAVIEFPMNANRINNPMANGIPIGDTRFTSTLNGLAFIVAGTYHRVCNVGTGAISNHTQQPVIINPQVAFLKYSFGYDAISNRYKIARFTHLFDELGEGTSIHIHTCGIDPNWRDLGRIPFGITDNDVTIPNEGISTMVGGSSMVSFLGDLVLDDDVPRIRVLTFNFSTEEIYTFPPPANNNEDPILCNLRNKLCCAFYEETTLRIFQERPNHTWRLAININGLPNLGVQQAFLPIELHDTKLLVAYIGWLNEEDDDPPEFPVEALNFFNQSRGLLIDTVSGTLEVIDCFETFRWFSAKTVVMTDEPLPY